MFSSFEKSGTFASCSAIITLTGTTTIYGQGTTNSGSASSFMKAATTSYGSGNNATRIVAIKLA